MSHRNIALALCLALAGCGKRSESTPPPAPQPAPIVADWTSVSRAGPDEHGVVCYSQGYYTLSCVKVQP